MCISMFKAQETADGKDSASNRLKTPFNEQQARNKEKIIIITLQGTILNEDREIPNISAFLNIMKKATNFKFIYLGSIDAKEMKMIRKLFRSYAFPDGIILLKNKHHDVDQHFSSNLEKLRAEYDIQMMITSNEKASLYSRILKIPIVKTPINAEWDLEKRKEIMVKSGSSFLFYD